MISQGGSFIQQKTSKKSIQQQPGAPKAPPKVKAKAKARTSGDFLGIFFSESTHERLHEKKGPNGWYKYRVYRESNFHLGYTTGCFRGFFGDEILPSK